MAKFVQDPVTLELVPEEEYYRGREVNVAPAIIPDIIPFRSFATSDRPVISSRSTLRAYCKSNGLVPEQECRGLPKRQAVEKYRPDRSQIKRDLVRAYDKVMTRS